MNSKPTNFGQFWYPDFIGVAYVFENGGLVICPYFDDEKKARDVYSKIESWNPKFVRVRFIEYGSESYAFIAYQNPKTSFVKLNFGLYRSSMSRQGHYSTAKNKIQTENCALSIVHSPNPTDPKSFRDVGIPIKIGDCKVINEAELESTDYLIEKWAHETCRADKDLN